jgi:glycosyltransferase involved in cell wall biosynthesis
VLGGIAAAHFNLAAALREAGWSVRAFAYDDRVDAEDDAEVRRTAPHGLISAVRAACRLGFALASPSRPSYQLAEALGGALAGRRLAAALERYRPDVVITPDKGCPLAFARKPEGARVVWISHHNPMRFTGPEASPRLSALDARLAVAVEARALRNTDLVLCPSRYMRDEFLRTYRFAGPVEIFPNLVSSQLGKLPPPAPPLREKLALAADAPLFYLPGAGTAVKGGQYLAEILADIGRRYPQAGVFVSGTLESACQHAVRSAPAGVRVFAPGQLAYADNLVRVRECDVAISPALLESFGMALLEAASLGVPVAAFGACAIPEVINAGSDGRNGATVPVGDIRALCSAADALLQNLRSGTLTRDRVARYTAVRFSTQHAVEKLGALLRSLPA